MLKRKQQETTNPRKKKKIDTTLEVEPASPSKAYAKPTADFTFKKLFGNEHNKALTINFLNNVFKFESYEEEKMSILDVFCTDTKGRQFIIEVQQNLVAFEKIIQYYAHKVHSSQLSTNSDYSDIRAVYTLVICEFKSPCYDGNRDKKMFLKETQYTFIELPKFQHQKNEKLVLKDQWIYMLKNYQQGPPENIWLISLDIQNILATFILVGLAVTSGASNIKADEFLVLFFLIPLATMISLVFPPLMFFLITKYQ
eukprot:gene12454-6205_t